jgi:undecaprenyl-diphosphatase
MAPRTLILLAALATLALPLQAQRDSTRRHPTPLVTRREAMFGLVGTAASIGLMQWDTDIARWLKDPARQTDGAQRVAEGARYVNEKSIFFAGLVLWSAGRLTHTETLSDVSWHTAEAVAITSLGTTAIRVALSRSRPFVTNDEDAFDYHPGKGANSQAYRSFPSLHSAAAYTAAGALTAETRRHRPGLTKVVAPLAFAAAAIPGLGRMHADKHWASDVAMGAVWGTMIGISTVRWHHEHDDRLDRWMLGVSAAPDGRAQLTLSRVAPQW